MVNDGICKGECVVDARIPFPTGSDGDSFRYKTHVAQVNLNDKK